MALITSAFEKAINSLNKAWLRSSKDPGDEELRDACIQRFEYTFELAWKLLKRQLDAEIANPEEVESFSKKTLFRVGGQRKLIKSPEKWFDYLAKRNLTSHTYNQINAVLVYEIIGSFIVDAMDLLKNLGNRDDRSDA